MTTTITQIVFVTLNSFTVSCWF